MCALRGCETRPTVYRPYPSRLISLAICRCNYKGITFSSAIWTMSVGATRVPTHDARQASPMLNQLSQPVVVRNMEWLGSLGLLGGQRWILLRFKSRYNQLFFFSRLLYVLIIVIIIIIIILIIIKYLYSAQSTICPWCFTLKKIFKKLKVLQHYIKKSIT